MPAATPTIPVPPEFSFEWDSPDEAMRFWTADLMHWPNGLSTLGATMDMPAFGRGMNKTIHALSMPMRSMSFKQIRGYIYTCAEPWSTDQDEMNARMGEMQTRMMEHVPGLLDRWYSMYEPEVRAINDDTLHGDYSKLGNNDLSALLDKLVEKREREGELHFLAVFPAMGAVMGFEQVYSDLLGPPKGGEHLQLLQGFPNKSVETDTALWRLSVEARKRPAALETLRRAEPSQAHAALAESDEGRLLRGAVEEFLDAYGWRGNELDVGAPTWKEDPTTVYKLVREFASRDDYNPEEEHGSLVAARQAREKLVFEKLSGETEGIFRMMLSGAQQYLPVQEDHNFWIDQQGVAVQRVPVLEAGRRLATQTRLEEVLDVFHLTFDELQEALRDGKSDMRETAARRKLEAAENLTLTPPPALGTQPPASAEENPMLTKFFGGRPEQNADPRIINGNGASAGKYTGTARRIMTVAEGDRLQRGDILVCPATMPPWTPLFGLASAVVTDHGGVLSHTAIVAREYQIPAVIGTKVGTSLIRDGQMITVDGDAGTVKLESD